MARTGYIYHEDFLKHLTGSGHPERPERLEVIDQAIREKGLDTKLEFFIPSEINDDLLVVHNPEYIQSLSEISHTEGLHHLDPDTVVCPESIRIAKLAAGAVIQAVELVHSGKLDNCFCAVRPPGHHAGSHTAKGFCIFNNIAIGAAYLRDKLDYERIAILDWDVHHGNGTQNMFYNDPRVFYTSIHQYPFYPGSGAANENGAGDAEGTTLNIPMIAGNGDDKYFSAFLLRIIPALEDYKPEFIMISAGFDAHALDYLASMQVSTEGFGRMTEMVREFAEKHCDGKIVSVLEGGYHLEALSDSVRKHLEILSV